MPIYEYVCGKCGDHIELLQKVGDPAPKRCAKCKRGKMEKVISRTSFQLKGSGWYVSDYASKAPTGKADGKTDGKADGKPEGTAESKPDAKAEAKPEAKPGKGASGTKPTPAA